MGLKSQSNCIRVVGYVRPSSLAWVEANVWHLDEERSEGSSTKFC